MGKSSFLSEYWRLLDLAEDFLRDGLRRAHPPLVPPRAEARSPATSLPRVPAGAGLAESSRSPAEPAQGEARSSRRAPAGLADIAAQVAACTRCALHRGRRHAVPGEGAPQPLVLVVGEGPGAEEDAKGRPFVGKAGQYLDKWLKAIELDRGANCFIANVVKCRPPGNRDPLPEESEACLPYLRAQIAALRPRAILAVGRVAAQTLTGLTVGVGELRRRQLAYEGIPLAVTYHPSAVLRDPSLRAPVWEDLQRLKSNLPNA
jgi:uracil-DNA glycosylase family 4